MEPNTITSLNPPKTGFPGLRVGLLLGSLALSGAALLVVAFVAPIVCVSICISLLAYAYVLYPLLMICVPGRKEPEFDSAEWPCLCVLIPTHNESTIIEEKLRNSLHLDYPAERLSVVVVVDDASTDATVDRVASVADARVTLIRLAQRSGKTHALNRGMETIAQGVVLLTDANVFLQCGAAKSLVRALQHPKTSCVSGNVVLTSPPGKIPLGETTYQKIESRIQSGEARLHSLVSVDGGMYVIAREAFVPQLDDTILDDFAISAAVLNCGRRIGFSERAVAYEASGTTLRDEWLRRVRLATGACQAIFRGQFVSPKHVLPFCQFVSHKLLRWLTPVWSMLILVSSIRLCWIHPIGSWALGLEAVLVLVSFTGIAFPIARRLALVDLLSYFGLVQAAMCYSLMRYPFSQVSPIWSHAARYKVD